MKKLLFIIMDWITKEQWSKLILLIIGVLLVPGLFSMYMFGTDKQDYIGNLGVHLPTVTDDPPQILDLRPKLGETIYNRHPRIIAQYENKANYRMKLMVNGEDVTDKLDYLSDKRIEYEIRDGVIPANYEVRLSFLDDNNTERAVQTSRFQTVIYDDFSAGNINWKNRDENGSWIFKNNHLEGTSINSESSSIEFKQSVKGNICLQFDAKIMPGYIGGIGAFFNSYYGVIIGDNDAETVGIYRDKQLLAAARLQNPLLTDNMYSILIKWLLRPSKVQNGALEAVIKVYLDGRLVADAVDPAPISVSHPLLGLQVQNSKVEIHRFVVYELWAQGY